MSRFITALFCLLFASLVWADATVPKADMPGAKDSPLVGRFAGSYIVSQEKMDFDEFQLPLGSLKPVADKNKRDAHNNELPSVFRLPKGGFHATSFS